MGYCLPKGKVLDPDVLMCRCWKRFRLRLLRWGGMGWDGIDQGLGLDRIRSETGMIPT